MISNFCCVGFTFAFHFAAVLRNVTIISPNADVTDGDTLTCQAETDVPVRYEWTESGHVVSSSNAFTIPSEYVGTVVVLECRVTSIEHQHISDTATMTFSMSAMTRVSGSVSRVHFYFVICFPISFL